MGFMQINTTDGQLCLISILCVANHAFRFRTVDVIWWAEAVSLFLHLSLPLSISVIRCHSGR